MSSYSHYGQIDAPYPLCQEIYNRGGFPRYALVDPAKDCHYGREVIRTVRTHTPETLLRPDSGDGRLLQIGVSEKLRGVQAPA
jgi:hypothetical protein